MPDEASAIRKFASLIEEATRWKGTPTRTEDTGKRRLAGWEDIDIRQTGLAIHVRVKTPWFNTTRLDATELSRSGFFVSRLPVGYNLTQHGDLLICST